MSHTSPPLGGFCFYAGQKMLAFIEQSRQAKRLGEWRTGSANPELNPIRPSRIAGMERKVSKEVQDAWKLIDAAAAGELNLDAADADLSSNETSADDHEIAKPQEAAQAAVVAPEGEEPEGSPIAAKSGSYTIPYEKLSEARSRAKTLEEENISLKSQLADLTARQQANLAAATADATARANSGQAPTNADQQVSIAQAAIGQGVDPELFGDFSEEAIAKGVKALVDAQMATQVQSRVDARVNELLAPMFKKQEEDATAGHFRAIYTAHPDTDSILDSRELAEWQAAQPAFIQESIAAILKSGTAQQVIDVFSAFKQATGKASPDQQAANQQAAIKAKVGDAVKAVADVVPSSLSELAGGSVGVSDVERATALAGDPAKLMEFMASLSPEKANRLMNSMV